LRFRKNLDLSNRDFRSLSRLGPGFKNIIIYINYYFLKQTLRQAIFLPNVEKHFPVYVNLLKLSGSGFFLPSGITWVDFVIAGIFKGIFL